MAVVSGALTMTELKRLARELGATCACEDDGAVDLLMVTDQDRSPVMMY